MSRWWVRALGAGVSSSVVVALVPALAALSPATPVPGSASIVVAPAAGSAAATQVPPTDAAAPAGTGAGMSSTVSLPAVAFTRDIEVRAGRLRTPVLVATGRPIARVRVEGLPDCATTASPGVVAWLDCAVPAGAGDLVIVAELGDGRRFSRVVTSATIGAYRNGG